MPSRFESVGKLFAKLLLDAVPVSLPLAPSLLRFLLSQPPTRRDYASYDPTIEHSCAQLLDMKAEEVEFLYLSFGDVGGDDEMDVTAENREEYVRQKLFYTLVESRRPQLTAIRKGFKAVDMGNVLRLFSVTELMDLLCGHQSLDCEELIAALEFSGFSSSSSACMLQTIPAMHTHR